MKNDVFVSVPSVQADGTGATTVINARSIAAILPLVGMSPRRSRILLSGLPTATWVDSSEGVEVLRNRITTAQYQTNGGS